MDRPRLGERPKSKTRSPTEYLIAIGCLSLAGFLGWRALGDWIAAGAEAGRREVVVQSADDCLGGLCAKATAVAVAK
ncbi:MAG: hypothetical protein FWD17_10375 [Polyangiaceae bacterium]|nr:hypothetical protein [Polyangiaceae bacterium]